MTNQLNLFDAAVTAGDRALAMIVTGYAKPTEEPLFVSLGMGVDSIAMLIGLHYAGIRPDAILFADTGSEKPETYEAIYVVAEWLESVGFPPITVVKKVPPLAEYRSLWGSCLASDTMPSLAFTGGEAGSGQCSIAWKIEPQVAWLKAWPIAQAIWAKSGKVISAVGYDSGGADSTRCAKSTGKEYPEGTRKWFPLRDWGWSRPECKAVIRETLGSEFRAAIGQDTPVKSACWMCPATTRPEVLELVEKNWDLALRALVMEFRALNGRVKFGRPGLGISWNWAEFLAEKGKLPADWREQAVAAGYLPADAEWDAYVARIDATLPVDERDLAKAEKRHTLRKGRQGPVYRWDPTGERKPVLKAARKAWMAATQPTDRGTVPEPEHNVASVTGAEFTKVPGKAKSYYAASVGRRLPVASAA